MDSRITKLMNYGDRLARIEEKRYLLLRFLREEIYTSLDVVSSLLNIESRQGVHKTLIALERDELIRRARVVAGGRVYTLWGITPTGQMMSFELGHEIPLERYFEPSRIPVNILEHTLDKQRLRLRALRAGWQEWTDVDRDGGKWEKGQGRPDALALDPDATRWAIEVERTCKTKKRYEVILADRLQQVRAGIFDKVLWVSPTINLSRRVEILIRKHRRRCARRSWAQSPAPWRGSVGAGCNTRRHCARRCPCS